MSIRNENFSSFRQVDDGVNSSLDVQDVLNTEVVDAQNMVFRNGYPESRSGSSLKWSVPTNETNSLTNLFRARDSVGNNYAVAVYAPNFYVRDDTNNQWVQINNHYSPSSTYKSYLYGYTNWNAGKGADVLYCGNAQESTIKWPILVRHLTVSALSTDTTLTVDDGSFFPTAGYLVVKVANGSEIYAQYASVSGNVITLSGQLGTAAASGATVVCQIASDSNVPKGNLFVVSGTRLFVAGKPGYEATAYFSYQQNPESFTFVSTDATSGGQIEINDGNGGITALLTFGEYVLATKADSAYKITFTVTDTTAGGVISSYYTVTVSPVFSDVALGPFSNASSLKKNNDLLFATLTEGLFSITPGNTGSITSVDAVPISADIYRLYHALNFSSSRAVSWNQFVLWSCATNTVSDTVLVLDLLKSAKKQKYCWTRFNNWAVQDWLVYKDTNGELLYFGNRVDGNIYQAFGSDYVDLETSSGQTPYTCSFTTKRYDYGFSPIGLGQPENSRALVSYFSHPDKLKVADKLHVQGFMSVNGTLYIDIMFNENGRFITITKSISGTEALVYQPRTTAEAMVMMGIPLSQASDITDLDTLVFINEYIPLPIKIGFTNIQFKFYTVDPGIHWGITGHAYNGILKDSIPAALVQTDTNSLITLTQTPVNANQGNTTTTKPWIFDATPSGTVNGVNTIFTTALATQVVVWADGILMKGGGVDYTFNGSNQITFTSGRQPYSNISYSYLPQ